MPQVSGQCDATPLIMQRFWILLARRPTHAQLRSLPTTDSSILEWREESLHKRPVGEVVGSIGSGTKVGGFVGEDDGSFVGFGVGAGVGFGVGAGVGFGVGTSVGFGVGFGVGTGVGFGVGTGVGSDDGLSDGSDEGLSLG